MSSQLVQTSAGRHEANHLFINVNMSKLYIDNKLLTIQDLVNTPVKKFSYLFTLSKTPKSLKTSKSRKTPKSLNRIIFLQGRKSFSRVYGSNKSLSPKQSKQSLPYLSHSSQKTKAKVKPLTGEEFWKVLNDHREKISSPIQSTVAKQSRVRSKVFKFSRN